MKNKLITGTLVTIPLAVSSAFATPNENHMTHSFNDTTTSHHATTFSGIKRFEKQVEKVGLTKAQHRKIDHIVQHGQYLLRGNQKQMRNFEKRLNQLAMSNQYTQSKVRKMAMNHADSLANILVIQADTKNRIFKVLTPEQRKKLSSLKKPNRKKRSRR